MIQSIRRPRTLLAGIVFLAAMLFAVSHAGTALVVERAIASPDAIVSLASHEWERLPETAALARRYPGAAVLLTLPPIVNERNCHDCARRTAWLVRRGVNPRRIRILPIGSSGTYGEALATSQFARRWRVKRLLVVTSPYHTRRSLATFRAVFKGTETEIGIRPARQTSPARPDVWWWSPYDRWYIRYEWSAIAYYFVTYRVNALSGVG